MNFTLHTAETMPVDPHGAKAIVDDPPRDEPSRGALCHFKKLAAATIQISGSRSLHLWQNLDRQHEREPLSGLISSRPVVVNLRSKFDCTQHDVHYRR